MIKLRSPWTVRLLAGAVPVGVAAAWGPLRDRLPNTDLALILVVVIAAVGLSGGAPAALAEELRRSLRLIDCEFEVCPPSGRSPMVARNVGLLDATGGAGPSRIDLPIWRQGEIVAHYRLAFRGRVPSQEDLRVALNQADQAGAAMSRAGGGPPGSGPGGAASRRGRLSAAGRR